MSRSNANRNRVAEHGCRHGCKILAVRGNRQWLEVTLRVDNECPYMPFGNEKRGQVYWSCDNGHLTFPMDMALRARKAQERALRRRTPQGG